MDRVSLSSGARANLFSLQRTSALISETQKRISTGRRVNSALDNPSSFFTASKLRNQASSLSGLLDSVSLSTKALRAADTALDGLRGLVDSAKAIARSAGQAASAVATRANITSNSLAGVTTGNLLGDGASVTGTGDLTTSFNLTNFGTVVINGTNVAIANGDSGNDVVTKINAQSATTGVTASLNGLNRLVLNSERDIVIGAASTDATTAKLGIAETTYAASGLGGRTLTVQNRDGVAKTVTFGSATSSVNTVDELNAFFADNDVALQSSVSVVGGNGALKIETTSAVENSTPAIATGTVIGVKFSTGAFSAPVLGGAGQAIRDSLARDYNEVLRQIDSLARDAGFNGVNLLSGDDLSIALNESGSSKLEIRAVNFDAGGLNLTSISGSNFYDGSSIDKISAKLDAATTTLEAQASRFGSNLSVVETRENFTKRKVDVLESGADDLTRADVDEEATKLLTLQARQQASIAALSILRDSEQRVLDIFA